MHFYSAAVGLPNNRCPSTSFRFRFRRDGHKINAPVRNSRAIGSTSTGTANTVQYFDAIGWGQWFRYLTGILDVVGAALICIPRLTLYGAIILVGSVGTGALIAFTVLAGDPAWGRPPMKLIPLVLMLLAATLGWLSRRTPAAS